MTTLTEKEPTTKATITTPKDRQIHIERIFNAPRERVWQAMTDPELVAEWWGRGNKLVIEKLEVKRGGHCASSNIQMTACTASRGASVKSLHRSGSFRHSSGTECLRT